MAVTNEKTQIVGIKKDKEKLCSLTHSSLYAQQSVEGRKFVCNSRRIRWTQMGRTCPGLFSNILTVKMQPVSSPCDVLYHYKTEQLTTHWSIFLDFPTLVLFGAMLSRRFRCGLSHSFPILLWSTLASNRLVCLLSRSHKTRLIRNAFFGYWPHTKGL